MWPPGGSGVCGRDAGGGQGRRVGCPQVSGDVGQDDPVLRRGPIQIVARRMAAFREQRVVVADPQHEPARLDVPLGNPRPDPGHDVVDVVDVADGRRVQRQQIEAPAHRHQVPVRVDEAGQQGAVAEIDDARRLPPQRRCLRARAGRRDRLAPDRHGLDPRTGRVHGDDGAADEDDVRRRAGLRRRLARRAGGDGRTGGKRANQTECGLSRHALHASFHQTGRCPEPPAFACGGPTAPRRSRRGALCAASIRRGVAPNPRRSLAGAPLPRAAPAEARCARLAKSTPAADFQPLAVPVQ